MHRMGTALAGLITVLVLVAPAQAGQWKLGKWDPGVHNVQNAVYWAFCGHKYVYCSAGHSASRVAYCETGGTYSVWSDNGQYENIFQMGYSERKRYGWHTRGSDPWTAAKAAFKYYSESGWRPWECKPY